MDRWEMIGLLHLGELLPVLLLLRCGEDGAAAMTDRGVDGASLARDGVDGASLARDGVDGASLARDGMADGVDLASQERDLADGEVEVVRAVREDLVDGPRAGEVTDTLAMTLPLRPLKFCWS
jgi:hypothetical protein